MDGVDWNVKSYDIQTEGLYPLLMAVQGGSADILQTILSVPEPHLDLSVTDYGRNIAQIAVEGSFGDRQRCLELLCGDRRVDWNIKNSDGDSPVMFCLKTNRITMATTLLANKSVDLDTVDSGGRHLEDIARSVFNI